MTKLQVILKNGKNGTKLFNTTAEVFQTYKASEVKAINQILTTSFSSIKTGNRNKQGRQFAMRAGV